MIKKLISVLLLIALCFSLSAPAYADSTTTFIQATNDLLASIAHATMHYAGLGIISDAISASDWSTYASNNFSSWLAGIGGVLADVTDLAWDGVRNRFILGSGVATLINQYINSFVTDNDISSTPVDLYPYRSIFTTHISNSTVYTYPITLLCGTTSSPLVYVISVDGVLFYRLADFLSGGAPYVTWTPPKSGSVCYRFNDASGWTALGEARFYSSFSSIDSDYFTGSCSFNNTIRDPVTFLTDVPSFEAIIPDVSAFQQNILSYLPTSNREQYISSSDASITSPSEFASSVYSGLANNSLSATGIDVSVGSSEPEPTDPPIIDGDLPQDIPNFAGRINDIADGVGGVTDTSPDNIFTRSGEKIHNWIEGLWDSFKTWLQQLLNSISSVFLTIWDNITSVLDDILDFLLGLFGVDNDFQDQFGGLIDGLSFGSIWHYVTSWIASISAFLGLLLSIWGNLPASMSIIVWASIALVIIFGVYHRFIS